MKVRLINEIGTRAWLRIYWGSSANRDCPKGGCHNAMKLLADSPKLGDWKFAGRPGDYSDPAQWPTHCGDCSAPVPAGYFLNTTQPSIKLAEGGSGFDWAVPSYQVLCKRLYDTASGEPEPGDMYWASYHHEEDKQYRCQWDNCNDPRGHLMVVLPNGHLWDIDSRASNCTMPDDRNHRCWVRHGDPPNMTVDKAGVTCQAGAGSIAAGNYHGFLINGELTNA